MLQQSIRVLPSLGWCLPRIWDVVCFFVFVIDTGSTGSRGRTCGLPVYPFSDAGYVDLPLRGCLVLDYLKSEMPKSKKNKRKGQASLRQSRDLRRGPESSVRTSACCF
jgi:hypothetical protein